MQFFKFKDYIRSWSTWVLGAVPVTPVLSDQFSVVGLIARAIKQQ